MFAAIAVLAVAFAPALRFSWHALPEYLSGNIDYPEQELWVVWAGDLVEDGRELDEARDLLERSLTVEPNGATYFLLGEVDRAQGRKAEALRRYQTSLEMDPTRAEAWLRTAELLEADGQRDEARHVLERGAARLEILAKAYVPVPDTSVRPVFNLKSRDVHDKLQRGLTAMRAAIGRLGNMPSVGMVDLLGNASPAGATGQSGNSPSAGALEKP